MTPEDEVTREDEAWFEETRAELNRLVHLIKDRAQGDETAIWRVEEVLHAHRRASVGEERTLLTALSVVFNAASSLCRDG